MDEFDEIKRHITSFPTDNSFITKEIDDQHPFIEFLVVQHEYFFDKDTKKIASGAEIKAQLEKLLGKYGFDDAFGNDGIGHWLRSYWRDCFEASRITDKEKHARWFKTGER